MSNARPLEVIAANPAESKAIVAKCEERITDYNNLLQRGERINDGFRFLIGAQILVAKPHLNHGEFEPWVEKKWGYDHRTANNWARFADAVINVGRNVLNPKRETVSLLLNLPEQLANGGLNEKEREALFALIPEVTGDAGMMDFLDQHAPRKRGGAMAIQFHCVHCGAKNTAVHGRKIECVKCGQKITAAPDRKSDEKALQESIEAAREYLDETKARHDHLLADTSEELDLAGEKAMRSLMESCRALSAEIASRLKSASARAQKKK